jgi:hypothetical protein
MSLPLPSKNRRKSVSGPASILTQLSHHPTRAIPLISFVLRRYPPLRLHRTRSGSLKLGLVAGAQFDWAVSDQPNKITITIKPTRKQMLERIREIGRKWKRPGVDEVAEFIKWREEDDRRRQEDIQ